MIRADDLRGLLPKVDAIAHDLYSVEWHAGGARCLFPDRHTHGDASPSLRFDGKRNRVFCASQKCLGEKGADAFALVQAVDGCDFAGAVQRLAERYAPQLATSGNGTRKSVGEWQKVEEYYYCDDLRKVRNEHTMARDPKTGKPQKTFYWQYRASNGKWRNGKGRKPVPLYGNRLFRERDQVSHVLSVEGEGKADLAGELGFAAVSHREISAESAVHVTGLDVVVWPDRDEAGRRYAESAAMLFSRHARSVRIMDPPAHLPSGGDIVDAVRTLEYDAARVQALINLAQPWNPSAAQVATGLSVTDGLSIYQADLPEPVFVVGEILPRGLTLFAGKQKSGKSWLALSIAVSVATGRVLLDQFPIARPGRVLYLALEEPMARTRSRLRTLIDRADPSLRNIEVVYSVLPLLAGGKEQISTVLAARPVELVVIDTFTSAVGAGAKGKDANVFRSEYAEVDALRQLALKHDTAILVVHHTRKGLGEGLDVVAGTGGLTAAADGIWILRRKAEGDATLEIVGRETEEKVFALKFNSDTPFGWKLIGEGPTVHLSEERKAIVALLTEEGPMKARAIAGAVRKDYETVRKMLQRMIEAGEIVRKEGNRYAPYIHCMSHLSQ